MDSFIQRKYLSFLKSIMRVFVCFISIMLVEVSANEASDNDLLNRINQLTIGGYLQNSHAERQANYTEFLAILGQISTADTVDLTQATPADLVFYRLADDYQNHPERLQELISVYGPASESVDYDRQFTRPPALSEEHATELYQTAWETLLLAPPSEEISFMQRRHLITKALGKIGSPDSIPVLSLCFANTCHSSVMQGVGTHAFERQYRILEALNLSCSVQSLQAMLECVEMYEQVADDPSAEYAGFTFQDWLNRFLSDVDNYGTKEVWATILKDHLFDHFTDSQRTLLNQVKPIP